MKLNLLILIILNLLLIILNNQVECKDVKISLLLSGDYNDLGYNYMMNNARVNAESKLKLNISLYYRNLEESMDKAELAIKESIELGANLIVVSSSIHTQLGYKYADMYKDEPIYWMIRGRGRPSPDLPKVTVINFNAYVLHYVLGYFSALMSKTGVVGFVSPGPDILSTSNPNSFYLGALRANSKITFLNIYTGSWLNSEVSYRAAQKLIANKADLLGMSQDDMSVQQAVMDSGSYGLGVTGFPGYIFNGNVAFSYVTDWTDLFVKYAGHVQNDTWPEFDNYFTTLKDGGSLSFDNNFGLGVTQAIETPVKGLIEFLKNDTNQPFRCNIVYKEQFSNTYQLDSDNCIDDNLFKTNKLLLSSTKDSKVIDFGLYTIPINFVDLYTNSMKLGISIVSGVCILFCLISMFLVLLFRKAKMIKSASPAFCLLILFGCIIIFVGCIIFSQSPTNGTCKSRVWLLSIGYTIFLGSLLVKNWRIWLLFDNPKLKKRALTNWKLYPWVAGILAADILILAFWLGLGDIRAESRIGIDSLSKYEYGNVCASDSQGSVALYILIIFHGLMLLVACFISFKIKSVDIDEFNESKPIATSVYIITFCLFIVIPLMVSDQSVASQTTIICVCSIVTTMVSVALLFGKKFYSMATQGLELNKTFVSSTKSSSLSHSDQQKQTKTTKSPKLQENFDDSDESEEKLPEIKNYSNSELENYKHNHSRLAHFSSDSECTSIEIDNNIENENNIESNNNQNNNENSSNVIDSSKIENEEINHNNI